MIEPQKLTISSEDDAFVFLEAALKNEFADTAVALEFNNWPILQIRFEGKGYDSVITPDIAEALLEIQSAINRAYARTIHHSTNARTLTAEERQALQFKAKVEKGSSLINVDLGEFAEKIGLRMVDKMTPTELIIVVLGLAVVGGASFAYKSYLKSKTEDKRIDAETLKSMTMTQQETERQKILASVVQMIPAVRHAQEDFDNARREIVRSVGDADSVTVNGLKLDRETAKIIGSTKRSESKEIQLNGTYFISTTDHRQEGEIRLRVKRKDDGKEFLASFLDHSLDKQQIDALQQAEWHRTPVYLSINATELRGEITTATVVSATLQPES